MGISYNKYTMHVKAVHGMYVYRIILAVQVTRIEAETALTQNNKIRS